MKFYISTKGIKRLTISSAGAGKSPTATSTSTAAIRRVSIRTVFLAVLVLALLLPFVFVRVAFLVLESATLCSSDSDCLGWRFFSGTDASLGLSEELTRALVEAKEGGISLKEEDGRIMESSFNELVTEMTSTRQDIKAFAFKTKAMLSMMEQKVQKAKRRESIYWHLASHGVPKSLHCLCLKLAEEYAVNALARSRLPSPEHVSRLSDPSYHHIALLTDNVLAASVVISSTLQNSANPEKLVFHIVTDKKTYTPMHAWFALNSVSAAVVEVKGLHQYDWSDQEVNTGVKETLEIHRLIWSRYYSDLKVEDLHEGEYKIHLDSLSPSCLSLMNHLRIYLPELFPDLGKILLLDDDVVVQRDISPLWDLDLEGNVISAAMDSWCREKYYCCHGRKYKEYMNFSQPDISSSFDPDDCAWLYGMNVFDLDAWRRSNITSTYHHWLKLNLNSGFGLWQPGELPPSLIAFTGQVHRMDPSWHVAGLGNRAPHEFPDKEILESAAVIHFSGPAKPWLEIGSPEVRSLWNRHVNLSHKFVKRCRILG